MGASGWYYGHWRGVFYPDKLKKSEWFSFYARHFDTVELNNTFYRLPKPSSFQRWHTLAPAGFVFAVKANRFITHIKRLNQPAESLKRFEENIQILADKLGCVLYQLPPSMKKDLSRLEGFLQQLPAEEVSVFEFRHESWYCDRCYELLDAYKCGFCVQDLPGADSPRVVTGRVMYVRFHGATARYESKYSTAQLRRWAGWIQDNLSHVERAYVYFNNDAEGNAIVNARQLKELLGASGKR